MSQKVLLKDQLFNSKKIEQLARELNDVYPSFKKDLFTKEVLSQFNVLELKARISWIAECLKKYLPDDYRQAVGIILQALPPPNNPNLLDDDFGNFIYAPYGEYVARYGCNKSNLSFSLKALYEITKRFSAEDAIRYFINAFPKETITEMLRWSQDDHYHVRRLASEGSRPKLPWSQKINISIDSPIPILDNLFFDKTRYVVRSVANHINDISKNNPDLAIDTLMRWKESDKQISKEMDYIIHHSLRSLVKRGNPRAFKMLGVSQQAKLRVDHFKVPQKVKMNTSLEFSFTLQAQDDAHVIVDYILYFQNKLGKLAGRKVFKLKKFFLKKGESIEIIKSHRLRQNMTTRKLFTGAHEIEIQINGKSYQKKTFSLI